MCAKDTNSSVPRARKAFKTECRHWHAIHCLKSCKLLKTVFSVFFSLILIASSSTLQIMYKVCDLLFSSLRARALLDRPVDKCKVPTSDTSLFWSCFLACLAYFLSKSAGLSQGRLRIRIYRQFLFYRQQTNLMLLPIYHVNMLMRRLPFSSREQRQLWSLPLSAPTCNSRHRGYTNTASQSVWNVIGFQFTEYGEAICYRNKVSIRQR